jgi:hypothetical protein
MNFSILIIGLILALIFVVPVVFLVRASSNAKKKYLKDLINLAKTNNYSISEHDHWNNSVIGIDKDHRHLFYINKTTNNESTVMIDLSEVKQCQVVNKSKNAGKKANYAPVTEKLGLIFTYLDKDKPETSLDFYNADFDSSIPDKEVKLAGKWSGIVNDVTAGLIPGPKK